MNDYTKVIDVNEVCKRFKLFRQNLEGHRRRKLKNWVLSLFEVASKKVGEDLEESINLL